ncbi:hypothetical protein KR044_001998 [Drosophila immigrans]|nr:hypothetical protein KR044_001998 [Drosophila immigrans]
MSDILETLFDDVLSSESALSVAQRLGNFNASLTQLTMANLQMLNRTEVEFNSTAHTTLLDNLRHFLKQPAFKQEVETSLLVKVYEVIHSETGMLLAAERVCLRKANNANDYMYKCEWDDTIIVTRQHPERTSFQVKLPKSDATNGTLFAFRERWLNSYLAINTTIQAGAEVTRNVVATTAIGWLRVVPVQDGVAIYDAATSGSVICGTHSEVSQYDEQFDSFAYTRRAEDFDKYRDECTWIIEDCSHL